MASCDKDYEQHYRNLMELLGNEHNRCIDVTGGETLCVEKVLGEPIVRLEHEPCNDDGPCRDPVLKFRISGQTAKSIRFSGLHSDVTLDTEFRPPEDPSLKQRQQEELDRIAVDWFSTLRKQGYFDQAQELNHRARRANRPVTITPDREATGTETPDVLCSVESGVHRLTLHGFDPSQPDTWRYRARLWRGGDLLCPLLVKTEIEALLRRCQDDGEKVLTRPHSHLGFPKLQPQAASEHLHDLTSVLKVSAALLTRFAERGHEAVLQDPNLTELLEPKAKQSPRQQDHAIERGR
jgi:hypothetical protein